MRKNYFLLLICLCILCLMGSKDSFGQNVCAGSDPLTSHYSQTQVIFNPAYSAIPENGELHFTGQNLANTFDSLECVSYSLSFNKFWPDSKSGLGGYLNYSLDPVGRGRYFALNLSYSYKVWEYLAIGGSLGLGRREALLNLFSSIPLSELERRAIYYPDLGFGIYLDYEALELGVGASHLNRPELRYSSIRTDRVDDVFFITGSYDITIDEGITLTPSVFGRYFSSSNFLTDFMVAGNYNEQFIVAVGYRIDLRRRFNIAPGTGFPDPERFAQALVSLSAAIGDSYLLSAGYNYTTANIFVRNKGNFEFTLKYILP